MGNACAARLSSAPRACSQSGRHSAASAMTLAVGRPGQRTDSVGEPVGQPHGFGRPSTVYSRPDDSLRAVRARGGLLRDRDNRLPATDRLTLGRHDSVWRAVDGIVVTAQFLALPLVTVSRTVDNATSSRRARFDRRPATPGPRFRTPGANHRRKDVGPDHPARSRGREVGPDAAPSRGTACAHTGPERQCRRPRAPMQ